MEDALRDGLAGVSSTEDLEATHALPDDEATRMLTSTAARPRSRQPLQPVEEPPRRAPQRRTPAPPPRRRKSGGAGKWIALVLVIALIIAGVFAYQAINDATDKQVQLNEEVGGSFDDAVQSFKDLIDNNTR
jgi:serine/threonine-protein kinase